MSIDLSNLIVAILAFGGAIYFGMQQMKKKKLSWEVLSITSLVNDNDKDIRKKLKILLDGTEVDGNLSLVLLRIVNNGDIPIKMDDFNEDIEISCEYPIVWASIKNKKPGNLNPEIETELLELFNMLRVKPLLLNRWDEFTIKLLVNTKEKQEENNLIAVDSRIEGIKEIEKFKAPFPIKAISIYVLLMVAISLLLIYLPLETSYTISLGTGISSGFLGLVIIEILNYIRLRKK